MTRVPVVQEKNSKTAAVKTHRSFMIKSEEYKAKIKELRAILQEAGHSL